METQSGWKIVKEDERYVVSDNDTLKKLVTSITILNPHHSTTGHSHAGQEEVYFFVDGKGEMQVNDERFPVEGGDVICIEDGDFHRVFNTGHLGLYFVCVFDGGRNH